MDLYNGYGDIVTHAFAGINEEMNAPPGTDATKIVNRFYDETLPNDVSNLVLPSALNNVVPMSKKLLEEMDQKIAGIEAAANAVGDRARHYVARHHAFAGQAARRAELASQHPAAPPAAPADGMTLYDAVTMGIQSL